MMKNNKITNFIKIYFLICASAIQASLDFPKQFLSTYDLLKWDTHEYNGAVLEKTKKSFSLLESNLKEKGFDLAGRFCIFGYQEEAIPQYTTNWQRIAIEDEVILKTHAGISGPVKNLCGFMTGFLLKDVQWLSKKWFPNDDNRIFHMYARPIPMFQDSAVTFQRHAFGSDYDFIIETRDNIERKAYKKEVRDILNEMYLFWKNMDKRASKNGSSEFVTSQDTVFSMEYAQALLNTKSDIKKMFLGPDITYPIEVLSCQKTEATVHAQAFVEHIQKELAPVDDQTTVYVFCSFVDGVGKSTLLNNIKNHLLYKDQYHLYKRCDNSSSQVADVFKLKDKVYIADLPAQMSHFVIKPEGSVFVDIETEKSFDQTKIQNYIKKNRETLIQEYLRSAHTELDPISHYANLCKILNGSQDWIPFLYESNYFLFNKNKKNELKVLVPLGQAHSKGLKVVEPEHMLFAGLKIPMHYSSFLDDLVSKLNDAGVKKVVFIDFLSMYPRTSRETIRLNFILQQIKKIFKDFYDIQTSAYRKSVYPERELGHVLQSFMPQAIDALVAETQVRWAIDHMVNELSSRDLHLADSVEIEKYLTKKIEELNQYKDELKKIADERLQPVKKEFEELLRYDSIYESIVRFSTKPLLAFSNFVKNTFNPNLFENYYEDYWPELDKSLLKETKSKPFTKIERIKDNILTSGWIHKDARNMEQLTPFIRNIRAQWYGMLCNLLNGFTNDQGNLQLSKISYYVPSMELVFEPKNNMVYKIHKFYESILNDTKVNSLDIFNIKDLNKRNWTIHFDNPHCLEWINEDTFTGLYAYNYSQKQPRESVISRVLNVFALFFSVKYKTEFANLSTTELLNLFKNKKCEEDLSSEISRIKVEYIESGDTRIDAIRLWVRSIATLDMIAKDPGAKVMIRKGNKSDFAAALKLLETVTLPICFGIKSRKPLFEDYDTVEPVISWQEVMEF